MVRRFHPQLDRPMILIHPGEYYVTMQDEVIATVLGSCISVCLRDVKRRIGGMNHFMLPGDFGRDEVFNSQSARYGMYAMEMIMGDMIKLGTDRQNLTAKVFGGGHVLKTIQSSANTVPQSNIQFVKSYLTMEGIDVVSSDVGGSHGRKVLFLPSTGKVYLKRLISDTDPTLAKRDSSYQKSLHRETKREDLTLF